MKFRQLGFTYTILLGLSAYIVLVVIWGSIYYKFDAIKYTTNTFGKPGLWDAMYFSCISFGTIGYGDIIPSGRAGQIIVLLESMSSILFIALYGGRITYLFLKRPENIIITDNIHIRPLEKDILFSIRIGNKGRSLVDCRLDIDILQIRDNIKRIIHKETFLSSLLEYSWRPALTLNNTENALFLEKFKIFYNQPHCSLIRITMRGSDIATGEVVAIYKYYKAEDIKISGDYLPLYNWQGFERTKPIWENNNKTYEATKEKILWASGFLKT